MKLSLQSRLILCFAGVVGLSVVLILFLMHRFLGGRVASDIAARMASAQHVLTVLHRAQADETIARFEGLAGEPRMKAYGTIDDTATLEHATQSLADELGYMAIAFVSRAGEILAWHGPGRDEVGEQVPGMLQAGGEGPRYDIVRAGGHDLELVRAPIAIEGTVEAMLLAGRPAGRDTLDMLSAGAGTAVGLVYSDEVVLTSDTLTIPGEHLATVDVPQFTNYRYRIFLDTREITGPPAAIFRTILIVGLLSVIVSVAVAVAVARWLSGPVRDLASTADAISGGASDVRAPMGGAPEVRQLSQAFNQMLDRLLLVQSSLRQNAEELSNEIERREELEDQLAHSQKMEAIGLLAGGIAHDFNNILTIVLAHCQLLLETLPETEPDRDMVVEITKAANRASSLTRQLLVISRRESRDKCVFDLNTVVANMETLLRGPLGEQIALTTQCEANLPAVEADMAQLEQVILNLSVNARDAMPDGGSLEITTRVAEIREESSSSGEPLAPGKYCLLSVRDTGTGMSRETINRMFEPFFTTKEKGKGTGLGLAMVYGVIRQSKGDIRVESEIGTGTRFEILLPAVAAVAAEDPSTEFPATMAIGSGTILLVEDDEEVSSLVSRVLQKHGYNVELAATKSAAESLASTDGRSLDLLLCDVVLPDGNGPDLVAGLRREHAELKVVFMSGHDPDKLADYGIDFDSPDLMRKPFSPAVLLERVGRAFNVRYG